MTLTMANGMPGTGYGAGLGGDLVGSLSFAYGFSFGEPFFDHTDISLSAGVGVSYSPFIFSFDLSKCVMKEIVGGLKVW